MTDKQINELQKLVQRYSERHGEEKGDAISGALMFSHDLADQIKVFKRARGREIVLEPDPDAIDAVIISYHITESNRRVH